MERGLTHVYCGDGMGKTTASVGLAVRAAGRGLRVVYVQFFKDGTSGEFQVLEELDNVRLLPPEKTFGFIWTLSEAERQEAAAFYTEHFRRAIALGLRPLLRLGMALGEGTGAVTVMPLIDMALRIYFDMPSFDDMGIEAYRPL